MISNGLFFVVGLIILMAVGFFFGDATGSAVVAGVVAGVGGWIAWKVRPNASEWRDDSPTAKQLDFADSLKIHIPHNVTKGELSDLITQAKR